MLSRFHLIPERHGRTDRQTDRFAISISRVSVRDKHGASFSPQTANTHFLQFHCYI